MEVAMASGVDYKELREYFERAESWDAKEARSASRARKIALGIGAAGLAIGVLGLGLYLTNPLTETVPYVIRVDERQGVVDVVSVARNTQEITGDEAVRKFFLADYVRNREAWIPNASDETFRSTIALSSPSVATRFRNSRDPSSATSPARRYRDNIVSVRIRGVTFLSEEVAQVRYSLLEERSGIEAERSDWLATIEFDFAEQPMNDATRFYNPLGFVVTSYRTDSELIGADL